MTTGRINQVTIVRQGLANRPFYRPGEISSYQSCAKPRLYDPSSEPRCTALLSGAALKPQPRPQREGGLRRVLPRPPLREEEAYLDPPRGEETRHIQQCASVRQREA